MGEGSGLGDDEFSSQPGNTTGEGGGWVEGMMDVQEQRQ